MAPGRRASALEIPIRLHDHVVALAAREPKGYGIRLYVEHDNHAAQATYRALGMTETSYQLYEQATRRSLS